MRGYATLEFMSPEKALNSIARLGARPALGSLRVGGCSTRWDGAVDLRGADVLLPRLCDGFAARPAPFTSPE